MQELQKNKMSAGAEIENLGSFELKILGILILCSIGPIGLIGTDVNFLTVNRAYFHRQR